MTEIRPVTPVCGGPSYAALVRYDVGELPPAERLLVQGHLRACPACRGELELFAADRDAFKAAVPLKALLTAADGQGREMRPQWRRRVAGLVPFAALAVLALWLQPSSEAPDGVRPKGGATLSFAVRTSDGSREGVDGEALRSGDAIRLRYSSGGAPYVLVVGVDADGRVFPYFEEAGRSRASESAGGLLPNSVVMDSDPRPERIFLLASSRPVAVDEVKSAARERLEHGATIETLERLPIDAEQATVFLRKSP